MESVVKTETEILLYQRAYAILMPQLESHLPSHLVYHKAAHTKAVIIVAEKLAVAEGVTGEDLSLLKTAALFHDAGFLKTYHNHEEASCVIAHEILPAAGFEKEQIETISQIIMATKPKQTPGNLLQKIICDADLHYLGTDHYFAQAEHLYQEFKAVGIIKNRKEWNQKQVQFLTAHHYHTPLAVSEYAEKKGKHLQTVRTNIKSQHSQHNLILGLQDTFLMVLGVVIAGFALKGFLVPNHFFDGGVTGVSLLIHELYPYNLAYIIVALNLPFIIAAYFSVSKKFALKTFLAVMLLGLCLLLLPYPVVTSDKLLISIFGGVFLGLGVGLTMRAGCALDGIEVLALYTLKRTSFTITEIILGLNIIIFSIAALKFGLETALYSVLTYFAASRMIDYVIEGIQAFTGVTIISGESELIKFKLVNELGRGITIYKGERGYLPGNFEVSSDCDIIFTVVTRMELRKLKNLVYGTDAKAFIFATTIREASGGILNRRAAH